MEIIESKNGIDSITQLVRDAKEYVVIVSPYNDLTGWDGLKGAINKAAGEINVSYYVRQEEGMNGLEGINATVYEVPLLHAKMFFSENQAMISSGNLTNRPDINWYFRLDGEEYKQIVDFFKKHIQPGAKQI